MPRGKRIPGQDVACPRCGAGVGQPCTSSGGVALRNPHEARTQVSAAQRRMNSKGLRGQVPDEYAVKDLVEVARDPLDPDLDEDAILRARVTGRSIVDHYIIETTLREDGSVVHAIEKDGEKWLLLAEVAEVLQWHRRRLTEAKAADAQAEKVLARYSRIRSDARDDSIEEGSYA